MASENLHERFDDLTPETRDLHRAITSLMEELEAVDWYQQRVDATEDEELKAVLAHNRDEEIEHAMMNLEWIRRRNTKFSDMAKAYLFSEGPITLVEKTAKVEGAPAVTETNSAEEASMPAASLGIGSLKL